MEDKKLKEQIRLHKLFLEEKKEGIRLNLTGANLSNTDLSNTNLSYANLSDTDLTGANLSYTDLTGVNLTGASLRWCIGNNEEIKTLQLGKYQATYTNDIMAIDCQQHSIYEWFNFDDDTIEAMDYGALEWWNEYKDILKKLVKGE